MPAAAISNIIPGLYLGDESGSFNLKKLRENKITHILVTGSELTKHYSQDFVYHQIEIVDAGNTNIISHFTGCIAFIENALLSGGSVFVHCAAGISRSTTIVMAYLMQKNKWNFDIAFDFVNQKRFGVCPNMGFQDQLKLFHQMDYKVDMDHPDVKQCLETWDLLAKTKRHYQFYD